MAKTSINPEDPLARSLSTTAVSAVAVIPEGYDPGQYDDVSRDIEVPTLSVVGNVGPLAKKFKNSAGRLAMGDVLLGESVQVIPVAAVKFYSETHRNGAEIKYGSPESKTRRMFGSASDAARAGYVVGFKASDGRNLVQEAARLGYLVVAPAGDTSGEFVEKIGALKLARAKCTYQRGGYRGTFRPIFNHASKLALSGGINTSGKTVAQLFAETKPWTHLWNLSGELVPGAENEWWETRASKGDVLPNEVVSWITENFGDSRV